MLDLQADAKKIIETVLKDSLPDEKIKQALKEISFSTGKTYIVSIGKAAYQMAKVVAENIKYDKGIIITKYGHLKDKIDNFEAFEAGHPLVDENSIIASERVLTITKDLNKEDTVLCLISGGGSALFEKPLITLDKLQNINDQLLKCGANIQEINAIRKRLSSVKGGKFLKHLTNAQVINIVLSDVIGNDLCMIASGPTYLDDNAINPLDVVNKYHLEFDDDVLNLLKEDLPQNLINPKTYIVGDVNELCLNAKNIAQTLGYQTKIIKTDEQSEAKVVGESLIKEGLKIYHSSHKPTCLIMGGETFAIVKGNGLGGRNQELILSAARYLKDEDILLFALGSDGSDGPTDAAGALIDKDIVKKLENIDEHLNNNDSYNVLKKAGGLIFTGPTGININDLMVMIIK